MQYKGKIDAVVKEINDKRRVDEYDEFSVYQESGMFTILRFGRRVSPVMTAKECYKALETISCIL